MKPRQGVYLSDLQTLLPKTLSRAVVIMAPLNYGQMGSFHQDVCKNVTGSSYESIGLKTIKPLRRWKLVNYILW